MRQEGLSCFHSNRGHHQQNGGVRRHRGRTKHKQHADDTVLIAENLQRLMGRLDVECRGIGLRINIGKTEVMGVIKKKEQVRVNVNIGGQAVKQVKSFTYLRSLVVEDSRCYAEIL